MEDTTLREDEHPTPPALHLVVGLHVGFHVVVAKDCFVRVGARILKVHMA